MRLENRKARRRNVRQSAFILSSDGSMRYSCTMVDVSATGAKLELHAPCDVADTFTLMLTESGSVYRDCKVSWRSTRSLGIEFVAEQVVNVKVPYR